MQNAHDSYKQNDEDFCANHAIPLGVFVGCGRERVGREHGSRFMEISAAGGATGSGWIDIAATLRAVACRLVGRKDLRLLETHSKVRIADGIWLRAYQPFP